MSRHPPDRDVFRAIATFTYDWESWIDEDGRVAWLNPAVERMTGYTVQECMTMADYPLPIVHTADRERIATALAGARKGSSGNDVELRVVHKKDGSVRWLAMSWQPIVLDGVAVGYRSSVRDINERKKAEEALQEADRAKSEFLAVMSHEIRSPMQAISGYAQLLARTELTRKQRAHVDIILKQNAALLRIVDDVLDFSALQSGSLLIERVVFDYREVVRGVLDATRLPAKKKKVALRMRVERTVPAALLGDPQRIRQVLLNLVHNAVKFTNEGRIVVHVRADNGMLVTRVTDTGAGIPAEQMNRLFEMFSPGDSSTARRHGGSGLGLAIAKRLCTRMEGDIAATSSPGKGSSFVFRVPLVPAADAARDDTPVIDPDLATRIPLHILVVDDSAVARDVACELLRSFGYAPDVAASARQAIRRVRAKAYDLVFLDMQMPGLGGLLAAREIRAAAQKPLSIVALTANVFMKPDEALDGVLTKPLKLETLSAFLASRLDPATISSLLTPSSSDGRSLLSSFAPRFRKEGEQILGEIERSLTRKAVSRVPTLAHKLKGIALIVGASGLAAEIEKQRTSGWDIRTLRRGFEQVLAAVDAQLSRRSLG